MPQRPNKATLTMPVELKRKARAKAIMAGSNLSQVVCDLLKLWVAGEIELPTKTRGKTEET